MKTRKFSFDLPRLVSVDRFRVTSVLIVEQKISALRPDNRSFRDQLNQPLESPPPTPRSVRPPLSPLTEAELRSACTYVVQNYKPSHVVCDEPAAGAGMAGQKQQLDYAAIRATAPQLEPSMSPSPTKNAAASVDAADVVDDSRSTRRDPQRRAEQLMNPTRSTSTALRPRADSHLRSQSHPVPNTLAAPRSEDAHRLHGLTRAGSGTSGSTPHTDTTDYPWSDRASTAMTSAAVTPARSSKRTSSHAWPTSEPAAAAADHRPLPLSADATPTANALSTAEPSPCSSSHQPPPSPFINVPKRKPVPARLDVRPPERERGRPKSYIPPVPPPTRSRGTSQVASRAASRARSISRYVKDFIRPSSPSSSRIASPNCVAAPEEPSVQRSSSRRAPSTTRNVRERLRSVAAATTAGSRRPSVDQGKASGRTPSRRSPSIDSYRSAMSELDLPDSRRPSAGQIRPGRVPHKRQASQTSDGPSRPSTADARGRSPTQAFPLAAASSKLKPPVDLNRELPPLPKLDDRWAEDESESRSPVSRTDSKTPSASARSDNREDILAARMGLPTPPRSKKASIDLRSETQEKRRSITATRPYNVNTGKRQVSRLSTGPVRQSGNRRVGPPRHVATTGHTPLGHTRNNSELVSVRKLSMEDVRNVPPLPAKERKWWQLMGRKGEKGMETMRLGVGGEAFGPVVRY
ncbi:hypothetical protein K470DRAFT_297195 [Piedraia hortae CBS 480.64]|uniref:Uncharacterized protein n=1 Tax=Piedraia hortae CBS 480.64 TaxID=1314780 RepID=A0A6A7BPJ1_9PEZI|nr:hypothetical protein K470DRAFT_297195 [Piedraia hortae CBS 480.64]